MYLMDFIRKIEEISMNCWPALQTLHYDGWVIRFADGLTKRSNSVNPLYNSQIDVNEKINYCEHLFKKLNISPSFKITEVAQPDNIDDILNSKGFVHEFDISVQIMDLKNSDIRTDQNSYIVEFSDDNWIDNYIRMNQMDIKYKSTLKRIIDQIILPKCLLTYNSHGKPIGCGLGVIDNKYVGLFDIVIDQSHRYQGFGLPMVNNILGWARDNGTNFAYLQVLTDNYAANNLYKKIGFKEVYRYWYRTKNN